MQSQQSEMSKYYQRHPITDRRYVRCAQYIVISTLLFYTLFSTINAHLLIAK
jgi:hypothetical protein